MALSNYQWAGIVVIIVAIILLVIGVVILAIDQSNQKTSEWWVWALIIIGVIGVIVGIALFFIPSPKTTLEKHLEMRTGVAMCPGVAPVAVAPTPTVAGPRSRTLELTPLTPEAARKCPLPQLELTSPCPPPAVPVPIQRPMVAQRSPRQELMPRVRGMRPYARALEEGVYCTEYDPIDTTRAYCPPHTAYAVQ